MSQRPFFIDLHCHPNYKPFARAHVAGQKIPSSQPRSSTLPSSLWFYDPPSVKDKLLNYFLSITKFRQANLAAAHYANLRVMVVGLGSVEKFFFKNKLGTGLINDLISDFVAGFRRPRIDAIQAMTDYWQDFKNELTFMGEMHGEVVRFDGQYHCYKIANSFTELLEQQETNSLDNAGSSKATPLTISLIYSCEGLHILNCGLENPCNPDEVLKNANALKVLPNPPFFVGIAHHFYNELCGHARSLRKQIGKITNQEEGLDTGFTDLGLQVLETMLDETKGKRIFVDIKHMSPLARKEYYEIIDAKYNGGIPIIISHGVCNGLPFHGATESNNHELARTFIVPIEYDVVDGTLITKDHNAINFYDDEILRMVHSGGIMGLQLDERRIANDDALKKIKKSPWRHKIMHYRSVLVWNQIQYMAELLDKNGLYAWGNLAIGSDYDGMVDPINSFWTVEEYNDLMQFVERYAWEYLKITPHPMKQPFNQITADKIVENIFHHNAWQFFSRWF